MEYITTACASFTVGSALTWFLRHRIKRLHTVIRNVNDCTIYDRPKMVLVVRSDLSLTPGKVASQCAHAAVSCYSIAKKRDPELAEFWEACGQPKIVVKCGNENSLLKLAHLSKGSKIIAAIVEDAGRTQTTPGTRTVLGIGPARPGDIDKITGDLKLY